MTELRFELDQEKEKRVEANRDVWTISCILTVSNNIKITIYLQRDSEQ